MLVKKKALITGISPSACGAIDGPAKEYILFLLDQKRLLE